MNINKIKINNYGNIKNKDFEFSKKINIIYGKNESGKSTILQFIINMLYGISKNKKGKEISDFEKYKPWNGEEFSGKLIYELDNNEKVEIYRDFNRKNPEVYNERGEEISQKYNINKSLGNEFFYEQTKVDENTFTSSFAVQQQNVKLEVDMQNYLLQKISNLLGTGEENTSYKKIIEKLEKRKLEEIGTERTKEKPINKIQEKLKNFSIEKEKINEKENKIIELKIQKDNIEEKINEIKKEKELLSRINNIKNIEKNKVEKYNIQNKIIEENNFNKKEIEEKINNIKNKTPNRNVKENKINKSLVVLIIINIISLILLIFIKNNYFKILFGIIIILCFAKIVIKINKNNTRIKNEMEKLNKLKIQIKLIEENNKVIKEELEKNNIQNNYLISAEKNEIKNIYNITEKEINNILEKNIDISIEINQKKLNENIIELNNIKYKINELSDEKNNINILLEDEKKLKIELDELKKLEKSIQVAEEIIKESYEELKNVLIPNLENKLSKNISEITNEKYRRAKITNDGIKVELNNGKIENINRLSMGTIEQIYLFLRLNIMKNISEENLPIFLDETFVYYDNERLEKIFTYLNKLADENQIIIFTCNLREKNVFDKLNIKYNLIELE